MSGRSIACIILLAGMLLALGCSGGSVTAPTPPDTGNATAPLKETDSNRMLWGIWEISFDPEEIAVDIEPIRNPQVHFNVTNMLIPPACDDCIVFKVNSYDPGEQVIDADVTLRNPSQLTGYDVRGILYTNDTGHELANADAWTTLWDIPGGMDRNPFKAFAKDVEFRAFAPAAKHMQNYIVQLPAPPQWGKITYAVDASWPGNCKEPYRIEFGEDFIKLDEEGVLEEYVNATVRDWQFDIEWVRLDLSALGATEKIYMELHFAHWQVKISNEWYALEGDYYAWLEAKSFDNPEILYHRFKIRIKKNGWTAPVWDDTVGITGAYPGDEQVMVTYGTATDPQGFDVQYNVYYIDIEDGNNPFLDPAHVKLSDVGHSPYTVEGLTNGHTYWFGVRASDPFGHEDSNTIQKQATPHDNSGWVRHIGGKGNYNIGYSADVDDFGNIYVTGTFRETVDFDPGPGVDEHTATGNYDAYLWKLDTDGNSLWARTWGGIGGALCMGMQVTLDEAGDVYIIGAFSDTVDFDPGPSIDEQEVEGSGLDAFFSKFDPDGNYQWTRVWGSIGELAYAPLHAITTDGTDYVYLSGYYRNTVDFDPGPGLDEHTSTGGLDAYLSKFDTDGNFAWVRTWGGVYCGDQDYYESAAGIVLDSLGDIYVTGIFGDTVDFDPGPETDEHIAEGISDAFLSKFNSSGDFLWAHTWGNASWGIAIDDQDFIYITGDDDNGPCLEQFNSDGVSQWSKHWEGIVYNYEVALDDSGNLFVTGIYGNTVDFDPGPDLLEFTSEGSMDVFLSKFDNNGDLLWTRVWGDTGFDWTADLAVNAFGDSFVPGAFQGTVDFFFGPGVDEHKSMGTYDIFLVKYPPDGNW